LRRLSATSDRPAVLLLGCEKRLQSSNLGIRTAAINLELVETSEGDSGSLGILGGTPVLACVWINYL
jgi:hypothetical protein